MPPLEPPPVAEPPLARDPPLAPAPPLPASVPSPRLNPASLDPQAVENGTYSRARDEPQMRNHGLLSAAEPGLVEPAVEGEDPRPRAARTTSCVDLAWTEDGRLNLRTERFLDAVPDPSELPAELLSLIMEHLELLRAKWDEMYPENPVESDDERGS